ncbi:ectomycorrhiza-regulated protein [Roridomyces roridus]|uniref:Ectomycorrhiza-regulated protein n=1 Tax=Roridomyces roridus TaxID=1738132 RepID=A0AAD7BI48_9AGAR|nr:ectomycorrhiza-regulated protein [Roridomyces roridus]
MSNMYTYPQHSQQLDYSSMQGVNAGYYAQPGGHYSPNSSPTLSSSMVGPHRTHPSINAMRKQYPNNMVPISDAPTQPRTYATPSLTSKKEIPAFFSGQRRRSPHYHSQLSDEEEDELTEEPLAPNATDQEKIEYKRRQNTLAARRSRKRKMMHQEKLEEAVERLSREKEIWKTRALTLSNLLRSHGLPCPDFQD